MSFFSTTPENMNFGAGEPLDELAVQFCLLHRHQKRKTVLFIVNQNEITNRQQDKLWLW